MSVTLETIEGVACVTLARPDAMNALDAAMRSEIVRIFAEIGRDDAVRAIVLTGSGDRAFCAGLDLKEIQARPSMVTEISSDFITAVSACAKPVVGAINGAAITGGLELALACDILVASTAAWFADTHAERAIAPRGGLSQRLPRLVGLQRAKMVSLFGARVSASTALEWGLVQSVVDPGDLMTEALAWGRRAAAFPVEGISTVKALIDGGARLPFGEALAFEDRGVGHS